MGLGGLGIGGGSFSVTWISDTTSQDVCLRLPIYRPHKFLQSPFTHEATSRLSAVVGKNGAPVW